jgi:AcrR family transcriptional regulator
VADSLQDKRRRFVANEIARTALRLFAEKGFDEVTIDEIAAEAGMSSRTFFRYYATKEDVVLQYQRRTQERLLSALGRRPAEEGPVTALREAYLATSTVAPEDRERVRMQSRFTADSRTLGVRSHGDRALDELKVAELLAERMGVDPATDPRPRTIAVSMGAAAAAAYNAWVLGGGEGDPAADIAAALQLLEDGLSRLDRPARASRSKSA